MSLIKFFADNFTFSKISNVFGGRKFIIVIMTAIAMYKGVQIQWQWVVLGIIYMFCNPIDDVLNRHMQDLIDIGKAWVGIKKRGDG